jgi:zinc-ribbon domain
MSEAGRVSKLGMSQGMSALALQADALLASLRMGGLGANAQAEALLSTARMLNRHVQWGAELESEEAAAVRDDNNLIVMTDGQTVSITLEPRSLTLSRTQPRLDSLGLSWSDSGSLSVEWFSEESEESWAVTPDGACHSGTQLDTLFQQRLETMDSAEPPRYEPRPSGPPRPEGEMSDWLGDFAELLPGLVSLAASQIGARAVKDLVTPMVPAPVVEKPCCSECGAELLEGAKFCAQCGHKLTQPPPVCECGRTFGEGENFCPSCGERRP